MRIFKRAAPLPSDPPAGAKLYDWEDIPIAKLADGSVLGYDPDVRPMSERCLRMALPISREQFDGRRAWCREYRAMKAIGGIDFELWLLINNELAARTQVGSGPAPRGCPA